MSLLSGFDIGNLISAVPHSLFTLDPLGGIMGGPGLVEGLFEEETPDVGLNSLFSALGLKGILPQGMKSTLKDAAPWVGAGLGHIFLPGIGGKAGSMAGNLGGLLAFGGKDARYDQLGYQDRYNYSGLGLGGLLGGLFNLGGLFGMGV